MLLELATVVVNAKIDIVSGAEEVGSKSILTEELGA
jgi:hypothetical protein